MQGCPAVTPSFTARVLTRGPEQGNFFGSMYCLLLGSRAPRRPRALYLCFPNTRSPHHGLKLDMIRNLAELPSDLNTLFFFFYKLTFNWPKWHYES